METITYKNVDFWTTCKRLFALALPMAGSQLISVASGFLCMAMLAQLGHEVLAASALIFTTQLSIMVSGLHKHPEQLIHMLKIGGPISVQMGGEMLSFFVSGVMIGWLGSISLAERRGIDDAQMV